MGLIEHAKTELEMAGLFDETGDFYKGYTGKAVMELIEVFSNQGHSGMSAPLVIDLFKRVAMFETLNPIMGKDEEWSHVTYDNDLYQNKRCSGLFKEGKDGQAYYIDGIIKRDQNGTCWTGKAWLSEEDYKTGDRTKMITSRGYVKSFPFTPKSFYVDVKDVEVGKDDFESFVVDPSQLDEIWNYYDKNK